MLTHITTGNNPSCIYIFYHFSKHYSMRLFPFYFIKKFKKGYECSSDGKAAQRHCNGEQLLKF